MDLLDFFGQAAYYLARAILLVLPLLAWQWSLRLTRPYRGGNGGGDATVLSGTMIGLAALVLLIPTTALTWDAVVTPGGVWDLTLAEFLERALRYEARAVIELFGALVWDDDRTNLLAWYGLASLIWLLRLGAMLVQRRLRGGRAFLISEVVVLGASFHGTVYVGLLTLWSVNQLNFWVLPALILLLQDFRHNEPPIIPRVLTALTGGGRRDHTRPDPVTVVD